MKKLVILALLILALVPVTALAAPQTVDLDIMSYAELLELSQSVQQAMMNFPDWKGVEVPEGKYVIGTDIPAGTYLVSLGVTDNIGINLWVFKSEDGVNYNNNGEPIDSLNLMKGDVGGKYLKLAAGNSIRVDYGSLFFKPYKLGF